MKLLSLYREKLWIQVMIPVSAVVAIVIIAIIIFNIRGGEKLIDKQLWHQSDVLIDTLEGGMYDALAVGDNNMVRKQFQRLNEKIPDMKIYVYDFNKNISFSTDSEMPGKPLDMVLKSRTVSDVVEKMIRDGKATEQSFEITIEGEPYNTHVHPIMNESRCYHCHGSTRNVLGGIAVCSSVKNISSAIIETRNKSIFIGISSLIALIILIYKFFDYRVNKRINILLKTAENVALGDLSLEKIKTSDDEIGQVNAGFRNVINSLLDITAVCEAAAVGDFTKSVEIRSEKDSLGKSVNQMAENLRNVVTQSKRIAEGDYSIEIQPYSENDELGIALHKMTSALKEMVADYERRNLLKSARMELNDTMRGEQNIAELAKNIISYICEHIGAKIGALYIVEKDKLFLAGSYAYQKINEQFKEIKFNQGLVGQAAQKKKPILLTDIPEDYIKIESGLGNALPRHIVLFPFLIEETVKGVIEIGSFQEFSELDLSFLEQVSDSIAIAVNSAQSRNKMASLLEQTMEQSEELEVQQEELRQTNEELEEQAQILEEQKEKIQKTNLELNNARKLLEKKADDLEISSQYKSEFLANMSHELRTPLNSILLLSQLLYENKEGALNEKQVEFAQTIYSSGSDLLALINEILDLSKVESGKMELHIEDINLTHFGASIEQKFKPLAVEKDLDLIVEIYDDLPSHIRSDHLRLNQIVKNFLSNALKFTSKGEIKLKIERPDTRTNLSKSGLDPEKAIAISVSDSGIGIPKDKFRLIFEAFKQADGTTSRKYGGTGLGLSISRELARYLGGEVHLESEEGKGSVFTLYLPEEIEGKVITKKTSLKKDVQKIQRPDKHESESKKLSTIKDDRKNLLPEDRSILIIEDDPNFAKILCDLSREKGFKILVASDGETGLHLADYYNPSAIILDINLPGMDGWAVMSWLKENPKTRHIPVHFISISDNNLDAMKMGAIGFLAKPVSMENLEQVFRKIDNMISKPQKNLLIVEDNEVHKNAIIELLDDKNIFITTASTGHEAYEHLKSATFDCIILDIGLPDMSGVELLAKIKNDENFLNIPIIVYTGKELTKEEEIIINEYAEKIIIKGVKSAEKLLDDTTLFLHRVAAELPVEKQEMLRMIHDKEAIFKDKKILLVDDDMRNVYAITNILEGKGMHVLAGKNGKEGLDCLNNNPDIDLVLMDIMMPVMDGYETIREIRKQQRFKKLPIVALTAKAMKGDRAKCIDAGANEYLAKPVDTDKLLSMLRVWLY
ncbi:MAG: response regulator [Desulfobacteraceae bacterium]|nr:response regulator [Desulfobacteraceae bacterium]